MIFKRWKETSFTAFALLKPERNALLPSCTQANVAYHSREKLGQIPDRGRHFVFLPKNEEKKKKKKEKKTSLTF